MRPVVQWTIAASTLLVVSVFGLWLANRQPPPEAAKLIALNQRLFSAPLDTNELQQVARQIRSARQSLDEERRETVIAQLKSDTARRMDFRIRQFVNLPLEQRDAFLDRDIDRMLVLRNARDGRNENAPDGRNRKSTRQRNGKPNRLLRNEAEQKSRRRSRLDKTSVERRAYRVEYKKALRERLSERGLAEFLLRKRIAKLRTANR